MRITVHCIRHAETDWNRERRFLGQTNRGLNALGHSQAAALGRRAAAMPFAALYASDLDRALDTARAIAERHPAQLLVQADARLREINAGRCEGLRADEILLRFPEWCRESAQNTFATPFPDGESLIEVQGRAAAALNDIAARHPEGSDVAVVTHGGVILALLVHVLGIPHDRRDQVALDNCRITAIAWGGSAPPVVLTVNA